MSDKVKPSESAPAMTREQMEARLAEIKAAEEKEQRRRVVPAVLYHAKHGAKTFATDGEVEAALAQGWLEAPPKAE